MIDKDKSSGRKRNAGEKREEKSRGYRRTARKATLSVAGRKAAKGAAKLKFLRSSDDAATHKKFKRFILRGELRRRSARPRPSLAFFSQYKLSFLALALSIDYRGELFRSP